MRAPSSAPLAPPSCACGRGDPRSANARIATARHALLRRDQLPRRRYGERSRSKKLRGVHARRGAANCAWRAVVCALPASNTISRARGDRERAVQSARLSRFTAKWEPVRRGKRAQCEDSRAVSDSNGTETSLRGGARLHRFPAPDANQRGAEAIEEMPRTQVSGADPPPWRRRPWRISRRLRRSTRSRRPRRSSRCRP